MSIPCGIDQNPLLENKKKTLGNTMERLLLKIDKQKKTRAQSLI